MFRLHIFQSCYYLPFQSKEDSSVLVPATLFRFGHINVNLLISVLDYLLAFHTEKVCFSNSVD